MKKRNISLLGFTFLLLIIIAGGFIFQDQLKNNFFSPRNSKVKEKASSSSFLAQQLNPSEQESDIQVVAENLTIPWEIVFLPDGQMLVTQRPGTLLKIGQEKEVIQEIEGVEHTGEGGLMGMALHPDFEQNNFIYLYLTTQSENGLINRVERYKLTDNILTEKEVILDGINGASYHDGGRIAFGPDDYLYVTTGDAGNENLAQDTSSLNGKILRITDEGLVPEDNPFGNEVWSYGHRNPQGLAWDDQGRLWSTEHGPSGLQTGWDELNLIEKGQNYGWPTIKGSDEREGMISPVIQSGADDTWAPAGMIFLNDSLFFAGLRGSSLYQAKIKAKIGGSETVNQLVAHLENEYGRLRAVVLGPDNFIYVSTSNKDGRGSVRSGDDKIIKINPKIFEN